MLNLIQLRHLLALLLMKLTNVYTIAMVGAKELYCVCMSMTLLIFGTHLKVIEEVKAFLSHNFETKDLDVADAMLNIKLLRNIEGGITLLQSHYAEKILSRFGYSDCKPSTTPYDASVLLRKNERIARDQLKYSQIIARLCT